MTSLLISSTGNIKLSEAAGVVSELKDLATVLVGIELSPVIPVCLPGIIIHDDNDEAEKDNGDDEDKELPHNPLPAENTAVLQKKESHSQASYGT